jgi:hypothetical protein
MLLNAGGNAFKLEGRLVRSARIDGDAYKFLDDPEVVIGALRKATSRVDLFTFVQRVSETSPRFPYPLEWGNFAALPVSTFDRWWTRQINDKTRNMVRRAAKKGVEVQEVPFDDALVRGIWEIHNETPIRQGQRFPHYVKDIAVVHEEAATFTDRSIFIGAFLGKDLGFSQAKSWEKPRS